MTILESYIDCMQRGDEAALADLFNEYGVLHDSSLIKAGMDTLHLEGRMAVEMMFHHKFGFNGGPFPIHSVKYLDGNTVWYFITFLRLAPSFSYTKLVTNISRASPR